MGARTVLVLLATTVAASAAAADAPATVQIVAGDDHTCVLRADGTVKCWGANPYGELGLGDVADRGDGPGEEMGARLLAVDLGSGRRARVLSAGARHTCALLDDGEVKCWGLNGGGELGRPQDQRRPSSGARPGQMGDQLAPLELGKGRTAQAVSAGKEFTCAILDNRSLKCWTRPRLAAGPAWVDDAHRRVSEAPGTVSLFTVSDALCSLSAMRVICWRAVPAEIQLHATSTTSAAGAVSKRHRCVHVDRAISCWPGPLEQVVEPDRRKVLDFGQGQVVEAFAGGGAGMCAVLGDGRVQCWTDPSAFAERKTIPLGGRARMLAVGRAHACAVLEPDVVKCWGSNEAGQLGTGDTRPRESDLEPVVLDGSAQAGRRDAYMVIVSGSPDVEQAARMFESARNNLPAYTYLSGPGNRAPRERAFPVLVESATVQGLKPGFWVVVAAIPSSEVTAKRLAALLGNGAYYRKVAVARTEDLVAWVLDGRLMLGTQRAAVAAKADLGGDLSSQHRILMQRVERERAAAEEERLREAAKATDDHPGLDDQ